MKNRTKSLHESYLLFISFIIYLFTFPEFKPVYGVGLDQSYVWALNYLVAHDYHALIHLIYPVGPLGFLKYSVALGDNLLISLLFFSIVKLIFIYLLLKLNCRDTNKIPVTGILITWIVSYFSGVAYSLIGITVISLIFAGAKKDKFSFFILANVTALSGLLIKTTIGIPAYSAVVVFIVLRFLLKPVRRNEILSYAGISLAVIFIGGLVAFRGILLFINYIAGLFHLASGYSSAMALFPANNWWLLSGFIITVAVFPLWVKDKKVRKAFVLLLFPLFAHWKLAMGREDVYHVTAIGFLVVFWGIILSGARPIKVRYLLLPALSVMLFYANMMNVPLFSGYKIEVVGINNFTQTLVNYRSFNKKYGLISESDIKANVVDQKTATLIDGKTIDIYPWDLSYVPANSFNWKPRTTLEIGAATSPWLSHKNAICYSGINAPDFVLFHLSDDQWGGKFGSIDGRYILNDEPEVIFTLLNHYEPVIKNNKFLLFEKKSVSGIIAETNVLHQESEWNKWISVPDYQGINRVKFYYKKNLFGRIKSLLYKGEAYYIDYRMTDGKILTYRFLADNASGGLWINPFILNPSDGSNQPVINEIRFRCSNYSMVKDRIELAWQNLSLANNKPAKSLFIHSDAANRKIIYQYFNDFETQPGTLSFLNKKLDSSVSFSGNYSEKVSSKSFSTALKIKIDTVWPAGAEKIMVEAKLMYWMENNEKTGLVISLSQSDKNFWSFLPLTNRDKQKEWKYIFLKKTLEKNNQRKGLLKIYIWNKGKSNVFIDDFGVNIYTLPRQDMTVK